MKTITVNNTKEAIKKIEITISYTDGTSQHEEFYECPLELKIPDTCRSLVINGEIRIAHIILNQADYIGKKFLICR